jgi:hypothetical protein
VRRVSAFGKSNTGTENNLLKKLKDRVRTSQTGELTLNPVREIEILGEPGTKTDARGRTCWLVPPCLTRWQPPNTVMRPTGSRGAADWFT